MNGISRQSVSKKSVSGRGSSLAVAAVYYKKRYLDMLEKVKLALLITSNDFDSELADLIGAAFIDLNIGDVDPDKTIPATTDPAIIRAVCCYCGYQFELLHGSIERSNAFKKSYDEQKAQMGMATGYTVWSEAE